MLALPESAAPRSSARSCGPSSPELLPRIGLDDRARPENAEADYDKHCTLARDLEETALGPGGAVAFIYPAPSSDSVLVVRIDGQLPGEPGYSRRMKART